MNASWINSFGLVADIIGALLLWRYGLPEPISRAGVVHLVAEQSDAAEIEKAAGYARWSNVGSGLLVVGFVLQLLSDWVR